MPDERAKLGHEVNTRGRDVAARVISLFVRLKEAQNPAPFHESDFEQASEEAAFREAGEPSRAH